MRYCQCFLMYISYFNLPCPSHKTQWAVIIYSRHAMLWVSQRTCYNMVVSAVQILVNLGQAALHIPQGDHTKTGCSTCLAVILHTVSSFGHCQMSSNRQLSQLPLVYACITDASSHCRSVNQWPKHILIIIIVNISSSVTKLSSW